MCQVKKQAIGNIFKSVSAIVEEASHKHYIEYFKSTWWLNWYYFILIEILLFLFLFHNHAQASQR